MNYKTLCYKTFRRVRSLLIDQIKWKLKSSLKYFKYLMGDFPLYPPLRLLYYLLWLCVDFCNILFRKIVIDGNKQYIYDPTIHRLIAISIKFVSLRFVLYIICGLKLKVIYFIDCIYFIILLCLYCHTVYHGLIIIYNTVIDQCWLFKYDIISRHGYAIM